MNMRIYTSPLLFRAYLLDPIPIILFVALLGYHQLYDPLGCLLFRHQHNLLVAGGGFNGFTCSRFGILNDRDTPNNWWWCRWFLNRYLALAENHLLLPILSIGRGAPRTLFSFLPSSNGGGFWVLRTTHDALLGGLCAIAIGWLLMASTNMRGGGLRDELLVVEVDQVPGEHEVELRPIPVLEHDHSHGEGEDLVFRGLSAFNEAISQV